MQAMPTAHDQMSGSLADASERPAAVLGEHFDLLSDVLRTVKLQGALFFMIDATSPWCVDIPRAPDYADLILPGARNVISYHVAIEGSGLASVPGSEAVAFEAGDIIVFPHASPYRMASEPNASPELDQAETLQFFRDVAAGKLPFVIPEGGGRPPRAKFICGFLGCDLLPFNPLLTALPQLLHIRRPSQGHRDLLGKLIDLAMQEVLRPRAGGESIRLGLCELMFVELLRRHLETLSADAPGWLTGLRDPMVGRALSILHSNAAADWTLDALAREVGASRTILAERFARCVGEPPMRYLTLWRIQLSARMLTAGADKIAVIGEKVGFRSEAAFSRKFKKVTGFAPSDWRRKRGATRPPDTQR
jgi:AraC-like DNA-binding protein